MHLNAPEIRELYQQSHSYPLDSQIQSLVNCSTLASETLKFIGSLVRHYKPDHLFEFGSGLSTLFLMNVLEENPSAHLFTVDHSTDYLQKTRELVGDNKNITYLFCPIRLYRFRLKCFATYDDAYVRQLPRGLTFDLVLIDGPLGYKFGREAPLYQIAPFLSPKALILLDDANRPPEQEAISNWQRVWTAGIDVLHLPELKKGLAVIQLKNPTKMALFPFGIREIRRSWLKAKQAIRAEEVRHRK